MPTQQRISSPIVGAKYHKGAFTALEQMPDDATVLLVRRPDNPVDKNAVAVMGHGSWHGQQLGFVLAQIAATLAPIMDARGLDELPARFDKGDGRQPSVSVTIERLK